MKIIKNISFFCSLLIIVSCLLMSSCSDNNFINVDTEIEVSDPDTIPYIYITGKVKNTKGEALGNIDVDYKFDSEVKTVKTDPDGVYEIRRIPEGVDRTLIHCHADGFISKMDIISIAEEVVEKDVVLAQVGELGNREPAAMSLNDSLVSLSGRVIDSAGDGIQDIAVLVLDFGFNNFYYSITDENGNWSMAIEPQSDIVVLAVNSCQAFEQLAIDLEIVQDTDLGDLSSNLVTTSQISVSGFITDCNTNEGLLSGSIQFSFTGTTDIYTADIKNGTYQLNVPICTAESCVNVKLYSYQQQSGVDEFGCIPFTSGSNVMDFEVCNAPNPTENGGFLTTVIDKDSTIYNLVLVQEELGGYLISAQDVDTNLGVILTTKNKDNIGKLNIAAVIDLATTIAPYAAIQETVNYQIDSITTSFMYGSFDGSIVEGATGDTLPFTGSFKARIQ